MRRALFAGLVIFFYAPHAQAQLAVYDGANDLSNIINAAQTVVMVTNQVFELTGLEEFILNNDLTTDLSALAEIGTAASGLLTDLASIQRAVAVLFDLDTAPGTSLGLQERLVEIRRLTWMAYRDALAVQTLLQSSVSALRNLTRLLQGFETFVGNNQGNQTLAQLNAKLTIELVKLREHTASFHRAQIIEHLTEPLIAESMARIREGAMADWPRP